MSNPWLGQNRQLDGGNEASFFDLTQWSRRGSNPQPLECHSSALPIAPRPQMMHFYLPLPKQAAGSLNAYPIASTEWCQLLPRERRGCSGRPIRRLRDWQSQLDRISRLSQNACAAHGGAEQPQRPPELGQGQARAQTALLEWTQVSSGLRSARLRCLAKLVGAAGEPWIWTQRCSCQADPAHPPRQGDDHL